jgi:hypothetical protein
MRERRGWAAGHMPAYAKLILLVSMLVILCACGKQVSPEQPKNPTAPPHSPIKVADSSTVVTTTNEIQENGLYEVDIDVGFSCTITSDDQLVFQGSGPWEIDSSDLKAYIKKADASSTVVAHGPSRMKIDGGYEFQATFSPPILNGNPLTCPSGRCTVKIKCP